MMNRVRAVSLAVLVTAIANAESPYQAGFARIEVTPTEPVRMAGYGSRDHASEGIDTPLYVRAAAFKHGEQSPHVLVSVDTIGLPGSMTRDLAGTLEASHGLAREQIVFCSTHTHCGPDLVSELSNIFTKELSEQETLAGKRYKEQLRQNILESVALALKQLAPATLEYGSGTIGFAANRRVLKNGTWTGFGVQSDGPVDHALPILKVSGADGKLRGLLYNYACHCTTMGGDHYQINAEWAGYASEQIESMNAGAIALCTIGCGADANPNPRGTVDLAKLHGRALAQEVQRVMTSGLTPISEPIESHFSYAGLSFELPTIEEIEQRTHDTNAQTKRHAEQLRNIYQTEGRLPATYPVPIQSWKFGPQLTMVFIGGEVVVDYALRLKQELKDPKLWVTAYANDVLGYIASERMRKEKGYEYDRSGIFYGLPGPWATGTEDLLILRIEEMLRDGGRPKPLEPTAALKSFKLAEPYELQIVATEPQVTDPVNMAFGFHGEIWVVEMGDYPQGLKSGEGGGCVKRLTDPDGDGLFDHATKFLSQLSFPTGVYPWRDGVIVSAAPEIFFARDRDGDGIADERETWYSGFALVNPQHRINGFTYGLDHSLHCASGDNLGELTAIRAHQTLNASGHDVQLFPETGGMALVSGRTQFIRSRNDWGDWFGNDNSRPMWHFVFDDRYFSRNPAVKYSSNQQQLFRPPSAPPVYPASVTVDRFNDLYAANRFTSACASTVFRSAALGAELQNAILVCEPVHNLIHRSLLRSDGVTYQTERGLAEKQSEFLASTDPWSRPVRALTGTDGMLYVVDMYRSVIEHPQWIPQAWQQQLDVRAGANRGRIYRLVPRGSSTRTPLPVFDAMSNDALIDCFSSSTGPVRDLAQQMLIHRHPQDVTERLQTVAVTSPEAVARLHALWTLHAMGSLTDTVLAREIHDPHPGVVRNALQISESRLKDNPALLQAVLEQQDHQDRQVRLQLALTLGESNDPKAAEALASLALHAESDRWMHQAIVSSCREHASVVFEAILDRLPKRSAGQLEPTIALLADLITTARSHDQEVTPSLANAIEKSGTQAAWVYPLTIAWATAAKPPSMQSRPAVLQQVYQQALQRMADPQVPLVERLVAVKLLGLGFDDPTEERQKLIDLIVPSVPAELQIAAVERLAQAKDAAAIQGLFHHWPSLTQRVREAVVTQCLSLRPWTEVLLNELEQKRLSPEELTASARQQLRRSGTRSMQVRADRLLQESGSRDPIKLVQSYLVTKSDAGDSMRGEALFKKHCAACHAPDAQGRLAGPNLNNLTDRSDSALMTAILDPNRAVEPQYRNYTVLLNDGRTVTGAIVEEIGDSLTLARADGTRLTLIRSEIEELRDTGVSLMPEGLQKELDPQSMQDLLVYLRSKS